MGIARARALFRQGKTALAVFAVLHLLHDARDVLVRLPTDGPTGGDEPFGCSPQMFPAFYEVNSSRAASAFSPFSSGRKVRYSRMTLRVSRGSQ